MSSTVKKKSEQLGMPYGTANGKLRKNIMFDMMARLGEDVCFQCGKRIESVDDLSIEHKVAWLDNNPDLFWSLDNIAFSHLSCNSLARRRNGPPEQPICRCGNQKGRQNNGKMRDRCKDCQSERMKKYKQKQSI